MDYDFWIWVTFTYKSSTTCSLEPTLEPSWWKRFCYLWLQAQTQTTVRHYHFQTIKPLGSTDCLQNPMQRYPKKLGIKCKKHKGRVQRTHREKLNRKQKYAGKNVTLQRYNVPKALLRLTASKVIYKSKTDIQILSVQIRLSVFLKCFLVFTNLYLQRTTRVTRNPV